MAHAGLITTTEMFAAIADKKPEARILRVKARHVVNFREAVA